MGGDEPQKVIFTNQWLASISDRDDILTLFTGRFDYYIRWYSAHQREIDRTSYSLRDGSQHLSEHAFIR